MLTTHRPGTVTLRASYLGMTNSATIAVKNEATLTHRYSFTTDPSDSVGGADGTLQGAATVSSGQLQLTGNNTDYLDLPPGLLQNYDAVTIEAWVNLGAAQHWARLWEFTDIGPNDDSKRVLLRTRLGRHSRRAHSTTPASRSGAAIHLSAALSATRPCISPASMATARWKFTRTACWKRPWGI